MGSRPERSQLQVELVKERLQLSTIFDKPFGHRNQAAVRNKADRDKKTLRRLNASGVDSSKEACIRGVDGGDQVSSNGP